ncbi:MAG: hypothetical protein ACLVH0_04355 [Coprococcus eutactus]
MDLRNGRRRASTGWSDRGNIFGKELLAGIEKMHYVNLDLDGSIAKELGIRKMTVVADVVKRMKEQRFYMEKIISTKNSLGLRFRYHTIFFLPDQLSWSRGALPDCKWIYIGDTLTEKADKVVY